MDAQFNMADGVVVTGTHTGAQTNEQDVNGNECAGVCASAVADVLAAVRVPVWVGSGLHAGNVRAYRGAHAFIVGTALKHDKHWANPLCAHRVRQFIDACSQLQTA
jgi:predicted TIM-barrel enzyme